MMESNVFADNFSRSFSESGDFFQFLSTRQARSKWMTAHFDHSIATACVIPLYTLFKRV